MRLFRPEGQDDLKETLVNFILDETGSMFECKKATISGFNEYVQSLRRETNENLIINMSLTKFNSNKIEVVYSNKNISEVPLLNDDNYDPKANTPLYDAIWRTVEYVDKELKGRKGQKIICVILTDGEENSSTKCNKENIFELIKKKENEGWNFVYLGANQDAWTVGMGMGLHSGNISAYTVGVSGYAGVFRALAVDTITYAYGTSSNTTNFISKDYQVKDETDEKEK